MTARETFRRFDEDGSNRDYQEYVAELDRRTTRFAKEVGKPAVKLLRQLGVDNVRRYGDFKPQGGPVFITTSQSRLVQFPRSQQFPVTAARLTVVKEREPFFGIMLALANTVPTDYLARTGFGKVTHARLAIIERNSPDRVRQVEANTFVYAHSQPVTTRNFTQRAPTIEQQFAQYAELSDTLHSQLEQLREM